MEIQRLIQALPLIVIAILLWNGFKNQNGGPNYSYLQPTALGEKLADSIPQKRLSPPTESWSVVKIADGDTITVRRGSRKEKIRFCGVDSVEKQQKLGTQATNYLRSLIGLGDGTVLVTPIEKDRYERTVAELFVKPRPGTPGYQPEEEIFLNGEMVEAGFARHYSLYSGSCPNKEVIEKSEAIAKASRVGFWSDPNAVAPWDYRKLKRQNRGN
jgi:endonuclease YncB( thermonuclease family)